MVWDDLGDFIKENRVMFVFTILLLAIMVFFLSEGVYPNQVARPTNSLIPAISKPEAIDTVLVEPLHSMPEIKQPPHIQSHESQPIQFLPVRPAKIGIPNKEEATELVLQIVNGVPELSNTPKNIKAGITFYARNPDGSITDIPESNLSFTLEPTGRLRFGLVEGINVKIRLPISRLEDLSQNFCQGVKESIQHNEFGFEWDISATDKIALIAASVPVRLRCGLD